MGSISSIVLIFLCILSVRCLIKKLKDRAINRGEIYEVVGEGYNDRGQENRNCASHHL